MGQPHLSDVYLVHISSHTNCTKKSRFQTPSCCPAASTQLRQIRKYLWQKIFQLPSRLFGGRPLLRTGCCGKFSFQLSKGHHLTTCFGPPHVPATGVAKKIYLQIDGSSFQSADNEKPISHAHSYESSYLSKVHPAHGPN